MKINLDYKIVLKEGEPSKLTNQEFTQHYLQLAMNSTYEKGMDGNTRRVWARIDRKLDDAILAKSDKIELEKAEEDLIRNALNGAKFPPYLAKYVSVLEDEVQSWTK